MSAGSELMGFALIMAVGQFSPGPDMVLLTRTSLAEGLKAGLLMVVGIVTGLALHAAIAIRGMALIFSQGGWLPVVMKWAAVIYLLWLAVGLLRKKLAGGEVSAAKRSPYWRGLFCNLLNAKVAIFLASIVSPYLLGKEDLGLLLWLIIVSEGLVLWSLWVWLLQRPAVREGYQKISRPLDVIFAVGLGMLAVKLGSR